MCFWENSVLEVPAGTELQARALLHAPPSLLSVLKAAGGDMVLASETGGVGQVPKCCDSMSGVGGEFVVSPSGCCASAWLQSWSGFGLFLPPLGGDKERKPGEAVSEMS